MNTFTFRQLAFFSLVFLLFNLPPTNGHAIPDECADNEVIELESDHSRHTVFISEAVQNISICNLKPGKKYNIIVNSFEQNSDCVFELTHAKVLRAENFISDSNQFEFKATESCMDFVIRNSNCTPADEYVVEVSVSCINCESGGMQNLLQMAGIATDPNYTTQQLIEDVFIGGGCFEISNVTPIGNAAGRGYFSNGSSSIGIEEGVILASGAIANAHGPNDVTNITTDFGDGSGDPDLNILSGGVVRDDVGIEFDFTPTLDMIEFNYVFASDEYCDYVNTTFNDVFGFFISGPGINGGFTFGGENIALIPGTNLNVSINNVNIQTNSTYYVDNVPLGQPQQGPFPCTVDLSQQGAAINDCEYDGFTTVLTAQANVQVCETYHIRLVVGDVGDGIFDSAVFLEANSFSAGGEASMDFDIPGVETNGVAYEGCTGGFIIFERPPDADLTVDLVVEFTIDPASTATSGVDFSTLPLSITIPAGQTQVTLPFDIFDDDLIEGIETLILTLSNPCTCDEASIEMLISDVEPLAVATPDMEFCSETTSVQIGAEVSGGVLEYAYQWSNGMTTPNVTVPVSPGTNTFTVTVTDECGNMETSTSTIIVYEQEAAEIEGFVEVCNGDPEGTLTITFDGEGPWDLVILLDGTPVDAFVGVTENPFTYTVNETGTYTIGSMYVGPCQGAVSGAGVVLETILLLFPIPVDVSCFGEEDGSVFLTIAGGSPDYTYAWSNDTYEQNALNLGPGIYTVTVTDGNGCTEESTVEVEAPEEIVANAVETQGVDCVNPDSGAADLTVSGGTPDYTFEWDNGSTEEDPTNLSAGWHTVTVTDLNNCTVEASVEIPYESTPPIVEAEVSGNLTCEVSEVTIDGSNSSGDNISYEWYDENDILISEDPQINVNESGIYTLIVTNAGNGCTSELAIEVEEDMQAPVADAGPAGSLDCNQTTLTLDGSGSSSGDNFYYTWLDGSNTNIGDEISIDIDSPDTYTLIVTNNENGCTSSDEVTIGEDVALPEPVATVDEVLSCVTTEATLDGSGSTPGGNLVFQWLDGSNAEISDSATAIVADPGVYTLIITNTENGCTNETTIDVLQDIEPPVALVDDPDTLNCITTSVSLGNGSGGAPTQSYLWLDSNNNEIGTTPVVDVGNPGTYTLIVTNTENGCTDEASVVVEQDIEAPVPEIIADGMLTCANLSVLLDGTSSAGNDSLAFEWFDPNDNPLGTDVSVEVDAAGIYSLVITSLENGCTAESSIEVDQDIVPPVADAGQGGVLTCEDTSIDLDGSNSSGSNLVFQWFNPSGSLIGDQPQVQVSETGEFTLVVTNAVNGCTAESTVQVDPDDNLPTSVIAGVGTLTCIVDDITLDGSASGSVSGQMSLEWFGPNNFPLSTDPVITVSTPGVYSLIVTDTENGCTMTTTVEVLLDNSPPVADAGDDAVLSCSLTELTLSGTGSNGDELSFEWFDDTNTSISSDQDVVIGDPGVYTLLVTNTENGCTATDVVTIVPDTNLPVAEAGLGGTLNCNVDAITLNASGSSQGINFSYEWQTAGGGIISTDLQTEVDQPGVYVFIVTNNDNGCVSEDEVEILEDVANPVSDIEGLGPLELNCDVSTVTLDGNNSMPFGIIGFAWSSANGNILTDPTASIIELDQPGIYTLTVTNLINGCTDTATFEITDDFSSPTAVINPAPMLTCLLPQTQLTAINTSGNGTFEYQWMSNPAGGVVSGETTLNPVVNQSGVFTLTILNLENGCESEFQVTVDEDMEEPDAQASVDDELDCVTEEVQLDGTGSSSGPIFNYQWSGAGIVQGPTSLQPVVNQSGTFTLVVTNTENGCTNSADVFVNENDNVPSAVDLLVTPPPCPGDRGSIEIASVTGGEGPYLYSIDGGVNFHSVNLFTSLAPGHYPITIQDAIGCTYEDAVFIPEAIPVYVVTEVDAEIQLGDSIQLEALVNIPLSQIDTIFWTPSEFLSCTNCLTPYASPTSWTEYTVTVISVNGCKASDKIILRVKKDRGIYIPNAFSPHNNDGINDAFMIYSDGKSVKNINAFKVFDRWGELIYEDYNFMPDDPLHSWDGRLREEPLNPAVFAYFAEIEFIDGVVILYKGDVTLLR